MAKKKAPAGINKMEAVRQALHELGQEAGRSEVHKFVKARFGVDMNLDVISAYKAAIAAKAKKASAQKDEPKAATPAATPVAQEPAAATKKRRKRRRRRKTTQQPQSAPAPVAAVKASGIALTDIETVKQMVGRVGVTTLKGLIDVLAK